MGKRDQGKAPKRHTTTETHEAPTSDLTAPARTGGDILVGVLREAGVHAAFGVVSIHNLPLVEAVDRDLRFVPMRHEAAAVNAADGYARASGGVGVALTSTGTGAGNAAGSMLEALTAQSRVLHVTGNIDADLLGEHRGAYHEVPRQLQMLDAVSAQALRIQTARQARAVLTDAVQRLLTPPQGPVSVDWPIDLQYTADPDAQNTVPRPPRQPPAGTRRDIERAAAVMRQAKRPLIWAGGGARRVGAPLAALTQAWGAGVLTGANGRGAVPEDHLQCVGNFATHDALAELIEDADCLLTIGSHLRANETRNFELPLPSTHIQIDVDEQAIGRNYPVTVGVRAEASRAVPALLAALGDVETDAAWTDRISAAAGAARAAHRADIGAYSDICDAIRNRLPRNSPIVRDVTIPGSSWGNRLLPVFDPTDNVYAAGGGIGQGLAMAIGAAIARPDDRVLAMIGDGGLAVHLGELAVLAAEQPNVTVVLFNDGGYGVLRNLQEAGGRTRRGVDLHTPDFAALSAAFGLRHKLIASAAEFDKALKKAVGRPGPTVIEVDVAALRPRPRRMVPPVSIP